MKLHKKNSRHLELVQEFLNDPQAAIAEFSREFEFGFCEILRNKYPTTNVAKYKIFGEYKWSRRSVHVKYTKWKTYDAFLEYLENKCVIQLVESGEAIRLQSRQPTNEPQPTKKRKLEATPATIQKQISPESLPTDLPQHRETLLLAVNS